MPEGDTIHRSAARLRQVLVGAVVRDFRASRIEGERPHAGSTIEAVEAVGKHLLIQFDDGLTLQTHMRMSGSWHLYRPGERWQRPVHTARVVIAIDGWVAVCFSAPVVRSYRSAASRTPIDHLGVDLCRAGADVDIALQRIARFASPDSEIGPVLLDQRIACGIGNVYKSETLFACRVNPFTRLSELDEATRRSLFTTGARLLQANLGHGPRTTVATGGVAVYGRGRQPCLRCGTPIEQRAQGQPPRVTYWCPRCQPAMVRC
ncbi:MAG: DNA-formamidopyrimidine glycosylase family protein [Acidimicrobiales bacterium]